jgi:hypothetical protein
MRRVASYEAATILQGGGRDDQIGIVVRMAVVSSESPEISRSVQDDVGNGKYQRPLTKRGEARQLDRRCSLSVAADDFVTRHGGECEATVLARVRKGVLLNRWVSPFDQLRQDIRIQEDWRHELFEGAREIRALSDCLVEFLNFLVV